MEEMELNYHVLVTVYLLYLPSIFLGGGFLDFILGILDKSTICSYIKIRHYSTDLKICGIRHREV